MVRTAVFVCADRWLKSCVGTEVQASLDTRRGSAASTLLDVVCDAVIDLDENLTVKDDARKLSGLLMHGVGTSLNGNSFSDLVAPGRDFERFKGSIQECHHSTGEASAGPPAKMLTLRLRDAMGSFFNVVLYHTCYLGVRGGVRHLIGLQEASNGVPSSRTRGGTIGTVGDASDLGDAGSVSSASSSSGVPPSECNGGSSMRLEVRRSDQGGAEDKIPFGAVVVLASDRLPLIAAVGEVRQRLGGDGKGLFFADMVPKGGNRLAERILQVAGQYERGELNARSGTFGTWPIAVTEGGRVERCEVGVEFRDKPEGPQEHHLIKIKMFAVPENTRNSWRTKSGPLRASRRAPSQARGAAVSL